MPSGSSRPPGAPDPLPPGSYRAPAGPARAELREKGSRFVAVALPAAGRPAAEAALAALAREHPDATHLCWAWRLGAAAAERSSDAGEPAGTAGVPILQVLRGAGLADVVVGVLRWFGGTKLGKGGLARAYSAAARQAVAALPLVDRVPVVGLEVELPYERLGAVKRLVHPPEVELAGERYGERVRLRLVVWAHRAAELEAGLADLGLRAVPSAAAPPGPR
jgi:uncharacterized YigZ family protein